MRPAHYQLPLTYFDPHPCSHYHLILHPSPTYLGCNWWNYVWIWCGMQRHRTSDGSESSACELSTIFVSYQWLIKPTTTWVSRRAWPVMYEAQVWIPHTRGGFVLLLSFMYTYFSFFKPLFSFDMPHAACFPHLLHYHHLLDILLT